VRHHGGQQDLDHLRQILAALTALKASYIAERARLRRQRAVEIARLRSVGWTPQRLADAFQVARSAVNQWAAPPNGPSDDPHSGVH
jgi:hypothetical protein